MTGFLKGLAFCAALALPSAASAATVNYTIDGGGITFDAVTINGSFQFDTVTQTSSNFMLTVNGAGPRDGLYNVATRRNFGFTFTVARAGSGPDLFGAEVIVMDFAAPNLGSAGPVSTSFVGLGNCSVSNCQFTLFAGAGLQEFSPADAITGVEVGAQVPLPAGLPLLVGGLGLLGVLRARRKAAAA